LAATITTHHLVINRNDLLVGGMRPHYYCLPVAKRESHRLALVAAAVSGDARFFLGTDSAPHSDDRKECDCCAAGCFTATNTLPILAEVFEREGALDRLDAYTGHFGADFYGLPRNAGTLVLDRQDTPVDFPSRIETGAGPVTVFDPGFPVHWRVRR
jgi:dihydroorotase